MRVNLRGSEVCNIVVPGNNELRMRRRTEEFALRNSAKYIRNFGISMAARAAAEKWPMRLFTKNTGLCEPAMGSIWTDTCPVLEG